MSIMSASLYLNLTLPGPGAHPAAWRHAGFHPADLAWYQGIARLAERGKFHSLYLPDSLAAPAALAHGPAGLAAEPLTLLGALAAGTERIGLIAAIAPELSQPYNIARRLATLDHASQGRAGWLPRAVTDEERLNFDRRPEPDDDLPQEYDQVLRALWDSWADDARQVNKPQGTYVDTGRVRAIDHVGRHFRVTGPLDIPRPPQGHVVLAAQHDGPLAGSADIVFLNAPDLPSARAVLPAARRSGARVLATFSVIASPSEAQVERRLRARAGYGGAWQPGWPVLAGTPPEIASQLAPWVEDLGVDGLNLVPAVVDEDLGDIVDYLLPELRQRGWLDRDYAANTLRGHYGLERPANLDLAPA